MTESFGTGRITEIINYLKSKYKISSVSQLSAEDKLNTLCSALQLTYEQLDRLIVSNSAVLRPIQGHVFETVFKTIVIKSGHVVSDIGGDRPIDLVINGINLQLKTPYAAGTTGEIVQYKTHKTHGPKSENESLEYYHSVDDFADYLVGLISYSPIRMIFLHKSELPTHPRAQNRIISPFAIKWYTHPGLNAFDRIGISNCDLSYFEQLCINREDELLPKTTQRLGVNTNIILDTILSEGNFRIWDMSIRGFTRELYFKDLLDAHNIKQINPTQVRTTRGDKADLALENKSDHHYYLLQIKGVSINNCRFRGSSSIVGVETQLTRGRVNDHESQSRLYLKTDFDILIVGIDPSLSQKYNAEIGKQIPLRWEFYAVPASVLECHHTISRRLKSLQRLTYLGIQQYLITDDWIDLWQQLWI